jgi:hypothetical protein
MLAAGEWRPTAEAADPGTIGFHLSAVYSPIGWFSWADIARMWEAAQATDEAKRTFNRSLIVTLLSKTTFAAAFSDINTSAPHTGTSVHINMYSLQCGENTRTHCRRGDGTNSDYHAGVSTEH